MTNHLTEKQEAVLAFLEEYQMNYGKSPTVREIREHFKVKSDNSIVKHIKALNEKGFIEKDDTPRGIALLKSVKDKLETAVKGIQLPVLGAIPAGGPVLSEEYITDWISVGDDLAGNDKDFFLLRVKGESMIDAGILEDDLVVVNLKKKAKNGDIVVALIDNENTLKRYISEGRKVYLKAENIKFKEIYPINELLVQGVVTASIRRY